MDRNNEYMVTNMAQGFVFSIIVIAILTYFLHKSWRMVIVFILPNLIPLLIIAGIMGFANIELKAATSLVFSIAFGVATDDTIHFISRLKIELAYGKSLIYAFKRTYFETGKPILLTTFILMGGFVSLMVSDFQSTFYFGFLICITIIIAVIADIFLLPVLLFWILGKKKSKLLIMEITLRPWHIDDVNDLVALANNQNIAQYMADVFPHPYTIENGKTFIAFTSNNPNSKIFAIIVDGKPAGSIGLHLQTDILRKNAEIGYWLGESYWNKGIITKVIPQMIEYGFKNLDIVRIFARIFGTNIASQKVVEKCGFVLEENTTRLFLEMESF